MTQKITRVAVLAHPQVKGSLDLGKEVAAYLQERQVTAEAGYLNAPVMRELVHNHEVDVVIALGGDGTVLRAGHLCAPYQVPILPINLGSFGFLIEVSPDDWQPAVDRLLAGDYRNEDHMMLRTKVWRGSECIATWDILNDTVIARGKSLRPVHLSASLDGQAVTTYVADALIVSTPTGSTAYALAAGGPILPPKLRNILLIPVAPHLSIDRAIVLAEGAKVVVTVLSEHGTVVSGDGQAPLNLHPGDRVEVYASEYFTRLIRLKEDGHFYKNLVSLMDQNPSAGGNS